MIPLPPLLAEIWGWIVPLVLLVIYALQHVVGNKPPPRRNPQRPMPRNPAGQPARPFPQDNPQAQLNQEVEDFLKQAADRRRREQGKRRAEAPASRGQPPARRPPPRRVAPAVPVTVVAENLPTLQAVESVASHVEKRMGNTEFSTRASHMVDDLVRADAEREQHRKQVFGHRVGTLTDTSGAGSGAASDAVTSAQATPGPQAGPTLLNIQDMRKAVILNEILRRPLERWED